MENLLEFKVKFASFDELILSIIWEKYDNDLVSSQGEASCQGSLAALYLLFCSYLIKYLQPANANVSVNHTRAKLVRVKIFHAKQVAYLKGGKK